MKVAEIKRNRKSGVINYPVVIGNYELSIQASQAHYCTPRVTLPGMDKYSSVELAILNKNGFMLFPSKSCIIRKFPRFKELAAKFDSGGCFCFVPVDLVNELIEFLENEYQEKSIMKLKKSF